MVFAPVYLLAGTEVDKEATMLDSVWGPEKTARGGGGGPKKEGWSGWGFKKRAGSYIAAVGSRHIPSSWQQSMA